MAESGLLVLTGPSGAVVLIGSSSAPAPVEAATAPDGIEGPGASGSLNGGDATDGGGEVMRGCEAEGRDPIAGDPERDREMETDRDRDWECCRRISLRSPVSAATPLGRRSCRGLCGADCIAAAESGDEVRTGPRGAVVLRGSRGGVPGVPGVTGTPADGCAVSGKLENGSRSG